jgi:hypothetical protein
MAAREDGDEKKEASLLVHRGLHSLRSDSSDCSSPCKLEIKRETAVEEASEEQKLRYRGFL